MSVLVGLLCVKLTRLAVRPAIFGSHLYTRFEPSVIAGLMSGEQLEGEQQQQPLHPTLSPTNKAWNYVVKPFQLPPLTRLMLADVDAGSDTPSLVGKVLKWRQAEGEAGECCQCCSCLMTG